MNVSVLHILSRSLANGLALAVMVLCHSSSNRDHWILGDDVEVEDQESADMDEEVDDILKCFG